MSDELSEAQVEELHQALLAVQLELASSIRSTTDRSEPVELDQSAVGRLSRMDAMQQQQMAAAQLRQAELRLKQVVNALQTFDADEYGWCKKCGEAIGYKRLRARPESPVCVSCMAELERGW